MKNLTNKIKTCIRHFNSEKSHEQYEWLTGCEFRNKLYCWSCLLFVNENGVRKHSGFGDLNNFHRVVKRHVMSKAHLQAVIKEKVVGKNRIEHSLDNSLKVSHQKHNELVDKNRDVLKRLVGVVCFLCFHELGFRGHDETSTSANRGNYMDLVSLISKYDPCLKTHLEQSSVFQGTSNRIQNDLISAISTVVSNKIIDFT
ncbi:zinc finger MYM-type protein 1-like [Diabrotica virgifera virgifera]|uniref:Zinc finger MYM-type protein 1-like n=1 Tax=Diabrotica virgifera virgifera TaxID=50390 RepID=A0ABM5L2H5_DIAVI|nr:zinc finger MYM-type protein 1-like [Diabrotica virgifera virgifera]